MRSCSHSPCMQSEQMYLQAALAAKHSIKPWLAELNVDFSKVGISVNPILLVDMRYRVVILLSCAAC